MASTRVASSMVSHAGVSLDIYLAANAPTLQEFGAVGNGIADDTAALLRAAASGRNIRVDGVFNIKDASIVLNAHQRWVGTGTIRQVQGTIAAAPADPNNPYGASDYSAIRMESFGAKLVGITVQPLLGEGVQVLAPYCDIINCDIDGEGRTWYDGINVYASDSLVLGNKIKDCGQWLPGVTYSQRGEGVFLSGNGFSRARVLGNYMRGNAKNGLFVIGYTHGTVQGNIMHGNRMSAIQMAFMSGLAAQASSFTVTGNVGYFNGADGFDCNNSTVALGAVHVDSVVSDNVFGGNGWLYPSRAEQLNRTGNKQETNDGCSATLIGVQGVMYERNYIYNNRRSFAYIAGCAHIGLKDNRAYKDSSATEDDTDGVRLHDSSDVDISGNFVFVNKAAMRLSGTCPRTFIQDNSLQTNAAGAPCVVTPTGLIGVTFRRNYLQVVSGEFISNCLMEFSDCTFRGTVSGGLTIRATLSNPTLHNNVFDVGAGNVTFEACGNVRLIGGAIRGDSTSPNGLLCFNNCAGQVRMSGLRVEQTGSVAALVISGNGTTGAFYIRDTDVSGSAGGNSIKCTGVTSAATIFLDGYNNEQGFADYGAATKKTASYV